MDISQMDTESLPEHHPEVRSRPPSESPEETHALQKASSQARFIICILLLVCPVVVGVMIGWNLRIHDFENAVVGTQFPGRNVEIPDNASS